jgi:hypothetical protein
MRDERAREKIFQTGLSPAPCRSLENAEGTEEERSTAQTPESEF